MKETAANSNLKDVLIAVDAIKALLLESESFGYSVIQFESGDIIVQEDEENDSIYIILDGFVELSKTHDYETEIKVDKLEPGNLVGVLTFWTGEPAFTTATAKSDVTAFRLTRPEFDKLSVTHPELDKLIQPLIISNLAERYRRIVYLNLRMVILRKELEQEKNNLKDAYDKLEQTSNRLVHQEKMATLGQLVSGVAHEINNPTAALVRSIDFLTEIIPPLFDENLKEASLKIKLFNLGLGSTFISSEEQRKRMDDIEQQYPHLNRSLIRILAQLGDEGLSLLCKNLKSSKNFKKVVEIENLIKFFEIGNSLKSLKISSDRIEKMVRSLRSYSKNNHGEFELIDLRQGLEDTLLILGNKIKHFDFHINMRDIPKVKCHSGEINQVWTNLIINATDAMGEKGILIIESDCDKEFVWVKISDSGPGIPPEILDKIFKPNFTTKTASGSFGLGLGLAISNEIIQKHGGKIVVENRNNGGASFTVFLPINDDEQ